MIQRSIKYSAFCLLIVFSQPVFPQYPKRANLAIIESDTLSNFLLLHKCKQILNGEGYDICKMNVDILFLTTMAYPIDELPVLVYYKINIYNTTILLRGYIMDNRDFNSAGIHVTKRSWERSACRSLNGSLWKTGFEDMIIVTEKIRSKIYGVVTWQVEENYEL
ncbi:hypothetical protein ACFLU5_17170 [Bacteroidota bacterium]